MESLQALLQLGDVCGEGREGLGGSGTLTFDGGPFLGRADSRAGNQGQPGTPFFVRPGNVSWASVSSEP